ncbi:hypothetical protein [Thermococcus sp.]|uniref:hypothetical protein n=1 Tax=Thermococcus sp. TaxID=35749 RepID=UPI002633DF32|nr:hypothetical protein [Thermococcus sp.]
MTEPIRDSVEVALELDESSVYSHIAHESAEDIIRIISSIDAERAKLRGEVIYYQDDWDLLIRERIAKGKRHTAFDFYNPALLDIWEEKVRESKGLRRNYRAFLVALGGIIGATGVLSAVTLQPWILLGLSVLPLALWFRDWTKAKLDLIYYELTQFFIDELASIIKKHSLDPERYRFKLFSADYFDVETRKLPSGNFAVVSFKPRE